MKLTLLGTGVCASQLPGILDRLPPGFLVEWGSEQKARVLFDCSEGMRFRLKQIGLTQADIQHVAISHPHPDHYAFAHFFQSLTCYLAWTKKQSQEIHLYGPNTLIAEYPTLWKMHTPEKNQGFFDIAELKTHPMSGTGVSVSIGNGKLSAFSVHHGSGDVDAVAYRLETPEGIFAYSGDTGECPGVREAAKDADIFVSEASARIGDEAMVTGYGHLTPFAAGTIAKEMGVKKLILVHYTGFDADEAMIEDVRRSGYEGPLVVGQDNTEFSFEALLK